MLALAAVPQAYGCDQTRLQVGKATACVELARTAEERARGLSDRTALLNDNGMLFVFQTASRPGFWMRNTSLALSIAFIDAAGVITDIKSLTPLSESLVRPSRPIIYALEMPRGWFAQNGIEVGDRVTGIPAKAAGPMRASSRAKTATAVSWSKSDALHVWR